MALYSGCFPTTIVTTANPSMDFRGGSSDVPRLMEYAINLGAATASTYGLGRSANSPVQTGTSNLQAESTADATNSQTTQAVTWSSAPTVPAVFFRRGFLPGTVGAGLIFTFPRGLFIASAAATLVNWNIAASSASTNIWAVVDE